MRRKREAAPHPCSASNPGARSSELSQLAAQLAGGPEQRVLHRFFGGAQSIANGPQLQSLVMLHFKYHALPRRKEFHGGGNTRLDFFSEELSFGIESRAVLALAFKEIADAFVVGPGV